MAGDGVPGGTLTGLRASLAAMPAKLKSRKFWVMFVASVIVMFGGQLGINLDPAQVDAMIWIVVAYLGGQGIADAGKAMLGQFVSAIAGQIPGQVLESKPSDTPTPDAGTGTKP